MKYIITICIIITLSSIFFAVYTVYDSDHHDKRFAIQTVNSGVHLTLDRPQIIDTHDYIMKDEMGSDPEGTLQIRETHMNTPYRIFEGPGSNEVLVYLPAFFEQSLEEQNKFSEKLQKLSIYTLDINIFTYSIFKKDQIQRFFSMIQPQFSRITFRFYDIPVNYYDIFGQFSFNMAGKDLAIDFYGKMFPDGFMMDGMIENLRNMLKRNINKGDMLNSIGIGNKEAGNIYFLLTSVGANAIKELPTKNLFTERILIDTNLDGPEDTLKGQKELEYFFQSNPIQDIHMENVGEKKDNIIKLYGF